MDDTHCKIIAWRHFNDELDLDAKGNRDNIGLNKVDFVGQTGVERSREKGQRMPGDYEAQISQGAITVHADEQLGTTDKGVVLYRRMLRNAIRGIAGGMEPPQPAAQANGQVPTMAGDVIVELPMSNRDDLALQREMGRRVGAIIHNSMEMERSERRVEIEHRVRSLIASEQLRSLL